ncbi:hypothetical protein AURANDRAFT_67922 [Aureococcus anophagefferens]|uniref:Uncharacterized protein n=1 Tax=Aureococcus anophagefferens TaxID=44056 RepID=F0YMW3_AURAN|nr:hypothetical protein AURANDRAFT_67922 [Aureococcus anophagefferens]EGB03553.1 hypothetical protein AURANDRAFT_67922 [Aureococcus anophagefferens]|eukprot:XP_009041768.1 hypothetical protein AURANDRAFT_67922 [Aureococcus anophagefferens]
MTNVKFREGGYGTDWVAFAKHHPSVLERANAEINGGHVDDLESFKARTASRRLNLATGAANVHWQQCDENAANKDTCSWSHHKKKCKSKRKACSSLASKMKCHKSKYHNFCKWSHKKDKCRNVKCKEIDAKRDCKKGCEWKNKQCQKERSVDSGVCVQDF